MTATRQIGEATLYILGDELIRHESRWLRTVASARRMWWSGRGGR